MTKTFITKVKKFGGSIGLIIPAEYAEITKVNEGDVLEVTLTKSGDILETTP